MNTNEYAERNRRVKYNRVLEVRKKIFYSIFSILVLVFLLLLLNSISTQASDKQHPRTYKYFKSVEIQKGDSLWSIAASYADGYKDTFTYVSEVKKMNSLQSDHIKAGSYLIIPYYSNEFLSDQIKD